MTGIKVPLSFLLPPFYEERIDVSLDLTASFEEIIDKEPLIFDILSELNEECLKPWEEKEKYIPSLLGKGKELEPMITNFFQMRDRAGALVPMKQMVKIFLAFLFWTNSQPVHNLVQIKDAVSDLKIKPVNVEERLSYILSAPNHHHAFTQLKELFVELQKKYAISKLK
ncbi:hypothetical protein DS745_00950 [Anaerobacillus alkaliphilus]|uniref:YpoC-like domain-containing protein n=1 Tax=Anaerobacillus alkaliphilus TaxID=1548597 RepID=A0A4Q0VZH5_9BACI|nr:hypothetical protein [Anaerobacillus alkaliphilus]RXJ03991.1 hypothetical protein DS745_00950 [Anaerobacillus alkaliphilus]